MRTAAAIRPAQMADLSAITDILDGAGLPTADLASAREFQSWVLEEKGSVVGVIGLERFGDAALLRSLAVTPGYRRRGLAHALVAHLEHEAQAQQIRQLVLLTETAWAFFRSLGYMVTDRARVNDSVKHSAEFRALCPESAICMVKMLPHD